MKEYQNNIIKFAELFVINFIKIGMFFVCAAVGVGLLVSIVHFLVIVDHSPVDLAFIFFFVITIVVTILDFIRVENNENN